jgi:hypothetical protein
MTVKLIGNDDLTYDGENGTSSYIYAERFLATAGTLLDIRCRLDDSVNVKMAIYSDNVREPNALLAYSASEACVSGWHTFTINTSPVLTATYFWIAFNADATYCVERAASGAFTTRGKAQTFSDPWPNPFPAGASSGTYNWFISGYGNLPLTGQWAGKYGG